MKTGIFLLCLISLHTLIKSDGSEPTDLSCPANLIKINLYTCAKSEEFKVDSVCQTGQECWEGTCTKDTSTCPTAMFCAEHITDYSIRCPDNSCVADVKDCPDYFECPSFLPIRCPNGDCRKSLSDCPSLFKCPDEIPVLCNDGSCVRLADNCKYPSEQTQCIDQSMTRCADGTCVSAKFLCPTPITCPPGTERCWSGGCAIKGKCKKLSSGESSSCKDNEILCDFDHVCKDELSKCSTGLICPIDKPVRCWDMSCKDSIEACPAFQECPSGMMGCADGSCVTSSNSCNTHITCPSESPYRCYDNTCKKDPADCPSMPNCPSDAPILCWDGRCLANREDCLGPSACTPATPVKCPDQTCKTTAEECKAITGCPNSFSTCPDGSCRRKLADCETPKCPLNFPYLCNNGMCVLDESHCEHENGCPFNKPYKCLDGACAEEKEKCEVQEQTCSGTERPKHCPDGSCLPYTKTCPEENGCPIDTPRRCADGACIDPKKTSCQIPVCAPETPIRCLDGSCVSSSSSCPNKKQTLNEEGLVECADGIYVKSYEECKPLIACGEGEVRCDDGSCRESKEYCPLAKTCPNNKVRCPNGSCATSEDQCLNASGCPKTKGYKCSSSGLCVSSTDECTELIKPLENAKGCPKDTPKKCDNGKCVKSDGSCNNENGCQEGDILCTSGKCAKKKSQCRADGSAPCSVDFKYFCFMDDTPCAKSVEECFNAENCKLSEPFRCRDGECKRYPRKNSLDDSEGCEIGIECPNYKPFLCADGECVEKSTYCKSLESCPKDKPYLCFDRTCAVNKDQCPPRRCPAKTPILCPNSNCVSNVFDCDDRSCPTWKPYKCANGLCKEGPIECIEEIPKNTEEEEEEEVKTYFNLCKDNEYVCNDGSCRRSLEECPLFKGCTSTEKPYKCPKGVCAASEALCEGQAIKCKEEEGEKLCEDGICRKECPEYNGCPFDSPLMCSTGRCVDSISECVGEGNCNNVDKPFRCIDGSCAAKISDCKAPIKEFGTVDYKLSIFPSSDLTTDIIFGNGNAALASLYVPSDAFVKDGVSSSATLLIKSVPKSKITSTFSKYNETRNEDIIRVFPYADPNGDFTLEYEYTVLSTVVSIEVEDEGVEIKKNILLTLTYDFPSNHETLVEKEEPETDSEGETKEIQPRNLGEDTNSGENYMHLSALEDVCLARLEENEWKCVGLLSKTQSLDYFQLQGAFNKTGTYAVILAPRINTTPLSIEENFLVEHLVAITVITLVVLIIIGICTYVFLRIYRYRGKYKETSQKAKESQMEMTNMLDSSTSMIGQTIGDTKEGVVFTDNPAFKLVRDDGKSKRNIQLEKLKDNFLKRLRTLERNNEKLKTSYENVKTEYDRLNDYKSSLQKGDKVHIDVSINDPNAEPKGEERL